MTGMKGSWIHHTLALHLQSDLMHAVQNENWCYWASFSLLSWWVFLVEEWRILCSKYYVIARSFVGWVCSFTSVACVILARLWLHTAPVDARNTLSYADKQISCPFAACGSFAPGFADWISGWDDNSSNPQCKTCACLPTEDSGMWSWFELLLIHRLTDHNVCCQSKEHTAFWHTMWMQNKNETRFW